MTDPDRLNEFTRETLAAPGTTALLSAVSAWEIAIKFGLGKLPLPEPPAIFVPARVAASGVAMLDMTFEHALHVEALPLLHRDPFDRLLVAQCRVEGVPIVTADERVAEYEVGIIWSGSGALASFHVKTADSCGAV